MTFIGMDPQQVLRIAQQIKQQQVQVHTVAITVSNVVAQARGCWHGPDVERFAAEWNATHRAKLLRAAQALEELARKATDNAAKQEQASLEYAGGDGAVAGVGVAATGSGGGPSVLSQLWNGVHTGADGQFSVGPHAGYSWSASPLGVPMSSSGDAWAGAHGQYDASASASLAHGLSGTFGASAAAGAGADWKGSVGNSWLHADDTAHVFAGGQASVDAGAKLGWTGANVHASGSAMAGAEASNNLFLGNKFVNSSTDASVLAGAKASGDAGAALDWGGGDAHAGFDLFAGTRESVTESVDAVGVHPSVGASFDQGVGLDGHADGAFGVHDVGGDVTIGGALGFGGDLHLGLHVDPAEALGDAGDAASGTWHAVSGGVSDLGSLLP